MSGRVVPTILCAGVSVLDHIFYLERFPVPDAKTQARAFITAVGGCAANAAIAIARLGGRVRFAAPLGGPAGEDTIGDHILLGLTCEGIDCAGVVRVAGVASSLSAILVDEDGERIIVNHRSNDLIAGRPADPAALLRGIDAVLIDNRFPEFVLPICEAARQIALPIILDADKPTRENDALLAHATHVIFSAEGLRTTAGDDDLAGALKHIASRIAAFVAVTDGANDILWLEEGALRRLATFPVAAIDTLAAGDVFHGAFALALAERSGEAEAIRFAAAAAAIKCTRAGGGSGAPTIRDVDDFLAAR